MESEFGQEIGVNASEEYSNKFESDSSFKELVDDIEDSLKSLQEQIIKIESDERLVGGFLISKEDPRLIAAIKRGGETYHKSTYDHFSKTEYTHLFITINQLLVKAKECSSRFGDIEKYKISNLAESLKEDVMRKMGTDFKRNFILGEVLSLLDVNWYFERNDMHEVATQKKREIERSELEEKSRDIVDKIRISTDESEATEGENSEPMYL